MSPYAVGGDEQIRTVDPLLARQVLSHLSYTPTPSSQSLHSSLLRLYFHTPSKLNNDFSPSTSLTLGSDDVFHHLLLRKEVIQPHLPIRLPCYDFTPITSPTFGRAPLAVKLRTSGITDSHGVTGGVYKARERIHRSMLIYDY